jgi:Cd2+/Zn2+-exporting ATPase
MLTGDNRHGIGGPLAVDEVLAELSGRQVTAIEDLVRRYKRVAMVGDGVNDAPAMARATGYRRVPPAPMRLETADITPMGDDPATSRLMPTAPTVAVIRQNIFAASSVKVFVRSRSWPRLFGGDRR